MRVRRLALALAALGTLASSQAWALFDDDEARRQIKELRTQTGERLDTQSRAQLDLANQIESLKGEVARLRGQVESLTYELETAKKRQQDFYLDLDAELIRQPHQRFGSRVLIRAHMILSRRSEPAQTGGRVCPDQRLLILRGQQQRLTSGIIEPRHKSESLRRTRPNLSVG